jgi:hypothetical protein
MIIANPIYDVVFKYLMQDLDIARDEIRQDLDKLRQDMDIEDEVERLIEKTLEKKMLLLKF